MNEFDHPHQRPPMEDERYQHQQQQEQQEHQQHHDHFYQEEPTPAYADEGPFVAPTHIQYHDHHDHDDMASVMTDLQTIEYEVGQRKLFPSLTDVRLADDDEMNEEALPMNMLPTTSTSTNTSKRTSTSTAASLRSSGHAPPQITSLNRETSASSGDHSLSETIAHVAPVTVPVDQDAAIKHRMTFFQRGGGLGSGRNRANHNGGSNASLNVGLATITEDDKAKKQAAAGPFSKKDLADNPAAAATDNPTLNGYWEDTFGIQTMPQAPAPPPALDLQYDNAGRIQKERSKNQTNNAMHGAFAEGGSAEFGAPNRRDDVSFTTALSQNTGFNSSNPSLMGANRSEKSDTSKTQKEDQEDGGNPTTKTKTTNNEKGPWWKSKTFLIGAVVIVVVILVAAVVAVVLSGGSSSDNNNVQSENGAANEEPQEELYLVPNLTDSTVLGLQDPDSVQSLAYDWAQRHSDWDSYPDWRKQQRYAMACLYYSFNGGTSGHSQRFMDRFSPHVHECDWEISVGTCPQDDGIVRVLRDVGSYSIGQSGNLPPEIALLSNLEVLDFFKTRWTLPLEDMLPVSTTTNLPHLRAIKFVDSDLKGTIPSSLGLLKSLEELDLRANQLTSILPNELRLLTNLTSLVLSSNYLRGYIPEYLGDLPSLSTFEIDGNADITQDLPFGFCSDDRVLPWTLLETDWCSGGEECCA